MFNLFYKLPADLETEFIEQRDKKNRTYYRTAGLTGAILLALFGILDYSLSNSHFYIFSIIRYGFIIPLILVAIIMSYHQKLFKYVQYIMVIAVILIGLSIIFFIIIAPIELSHRFYAGLILLFIFSYSFLRIRFALATFAGWLLVVCYQIASFFIVDIPNELILNNNFFFISANILGMFSNLTQEYQIRKSFHTAHKLKLSNKKLKQNNIQLEEKVSERTKTLEELNERLLYKIDERVYIENKLFRAKNLAEKANRVKTDFLAQMSHEIRSPVNTIMNYTSLIKEISGDVKEQDLLSCFNSIENSTKRVVRTIDLILNTSEMQLGTYESTLRKFSLNDLIIKHHKTYFKTAKEKNVSLIFDCKINQSKIYSDEYAVNQIVANILDNAVKYTDEGEVKIVLDQLNNKKFLVQISDTGKGIAKEYIPDLFEQFTQEESGYTRKYDGNGLGLSLVKKYCNLINAKISYETEINRGTTFTIEFQNLGE